MKKKFTEPRMFLETKEAKPGKNWILEILIFIAVVIVGMIAESIIPSIVMFKDEVADFASSMGTVAGGVVSSTLGMSQDVMLISLFSTVFMIVIVLLFCRIFQKRKPASLGFRKNGFIKEYLFGAVFGIVMIGLAAGITCLTGGITMKLSENISPMIIVFLAGFIIQGASEEVVCRGYFMPSFARKHPMWLAVLLNSVIFSLLHLLNPGFGLLPLINIILCGIVCSLIVVKRGNLWCACALHSMWNFFQGNIFGISVSGSGEITSVFSVSQNAGHSLLNGGTFGIEGGIITTVVEVAAILVLVFLIPKKKSEFPDDMNETREKITG